MYVQYIKMKFISMLFFIFCRYSYLYMTHMSCFYTDLFYVKTVWDVYKSGANILKPAMDADGVRPICLENLVGGLCPAVDDDLKTYDIMSKSEFET